jgi:hypothetical protein
MQNLIVHPGSATLFLHGPAHARERADLSPTPADRPAPPVSGIAARHCAAAHPSDASLPRSVRQTRARAAHVAHERRARATAGRRPPVGARPHGTPAPRGTPTPGPPPFPSSLSPSVALPPSRSLPARAAPLVLLSPLLSDTSSRAPEPPHRSPHPDRRLQPPAAPSPSRIPTEHRSRSPLPGELLPELPIPAISCNILTPLPLQCYRTPHPPSPPTGAPSPPTNAAARCRLHRLTVDPPFRCASALSSLPDTFPVTPSRSPATPCRRRATAEPPASTPPRRPMHGLHVVTAPARTLQQAAQAGCPAGLGCQAVAPPAFRPTVRGRPPRPVGSNLGPISARYCAEDFKCFSNCFK